MRRLSLAVCVGAALLGFLSLIAPVARAQSPLEDLPRNWTGEFRWDGAPEAQRYEITVLNVRRLDDNRIEANGCGRVSARQQITDINIRMVIDTGTLAIQIFEAQPNQRNFTTDGSHRGRISKD